MATHLIVTPRIKQEELHVWCANLRDFDLAVPALWAVLSPWERTCAERFHLLHDKENYIIRHGMLRMLLGAYVGQAPADLDLMIGTNGKPELRASGGGSEVHFNLSHSGDVALFGFTGACPIGVDVEHIQPIPHCEKIASEYFSPTEVARLMALPGEFRIERFFDLWTRKEALFKATGNSFRARQFDQPVSLSQAETSNHQESPASRGASAEWHVRSFSPRAGYIGAVAFSKPDLDLIHRSAPAFFSEELWCPEQSVIRTQPGT